MKTHHNITGDEVTTLSETSNKNNFTGASIEMVPVDELHCHPLSARIYGSGHVPEELLESVRENGVQTPIIASSISKRIVSGHTRVEAARQAGHTKVPVIFRTMSEFEEEFGVVEGNVARRKTNSMQCREFGALLGMFKKKAASGDPDLCPKTAALSKSQDKAAALIGVGASSLKKGIEVLEAAEALASAGDAEGALKLRTMLDKPRGFDPSHKAAIKMGVIAPPKKRPKKDGAKSDGESPVIDSPDQVDTAAQIEAKRSDHSSSSESGNTSQPVSSVADGAQTQASESPVSKLEALIAELVPVLESVASWTDDDKAASASSLQKLEAALATTTKKMTNAGITSVASLN